MLNFSAYSGRDLQNFMQMLNQCETAGVTDIRNIRTDLHKHLYKPQKIRRIRGKRKFNLPPEYLCPECKSPMSSPVTIKNEIEGFTEIITVRGCKNCGYSKVVG